MLGIFKKFLQKQPEDDPKSSSEASKASRPPEKTTPTAPAEPPAATRAPASAGPVPAAAMSGRRVGVPLKAIIKRLPVEILTKVEKPPGSDSKTEVPLSIIQDQLKNGAVKITFAELKQYSPEGTFNSAATSDHVVVELPLSELLNHLPKECLARNPAQKVISVPEEIPGLFGPNGEPLSVRLGSTAPAPAAQTAPPKPEPAPVPSPTPATGTISRGSIPIPPATPAAPTPAAAKPISPSTPISPLASSSAPAAAPEAAPSAASIAASESLKKALSAAVASAKVETPATNRPGAAAPASTAATPATPAAIKPAASGKSISVALTQASLSWPASILKEISDTQLTGRPIKLPVEDLGTSLKSGRVLYTWKQIRVWLEPAASGESAEGETLLEIPLKWVVPAFIAQYQAPTGRKKIVVSENIPSPFKGGSPYPSSAGTTPAAPAAASTPSAPAPAAAPPVTAAPSAPISMASTPAAPATPAAPSALGQLLGQPNKMDWTPAEVGQAIGKWPGIGGVMLATSDGLPMTAQLPAHLKAETVAAFLPQLHGKLENYLKEMKLDAAPGLYFTSGSQQWSVMRAGKHFLVVLSQPGQTLPAAQLEKLVKEMTSIKF